MKINLQMPLILILIPVLITLYEGNAFTQFSRPITHRRSHNQLDAKPQRLDDNIDGVLFVNENCINCAACSSFAPETFGRSGGFHVVHKQPETEQQIDYARAALAACPVAAIRVESKASSENWNEANEILAAQLRINGKYNNLQLPFPRPFLNDESTNVYWVGHHNEDSFGATPYIFSAVHNGQAVDIMVDTPKFSKSSVDAVLEVTGGKSPDYLFLSHVDDAADHLKWVTHFPNLKRIFHSEELKNNWVGDKTLADVEILLPKVDVSLLNHDVGLPSYSLDGEVVSYSDWKTKEDKSDIIIFHTPGHSVGSISLLFKPSDGAGILFTGDTYASNGGKMTGFPRYGNNLQVQAQTLLNLLDIQEWDVIAPGHGHPRDYRSYVTTTNNEIKASEMIDAVNDLTPSVWKLKYQ